MARDFAVAFYHSKAWLYARDTYMWLVIDTDCGQCPPGYCERCFSNGIIAPAEIIHHKIHLSPSNIHDPRITLSFDNFERLCRDCHARVHPEIYGKEEFEGPRVWFDEEGNVHERK